MYNADLRDVLIRDSGALLRFSIFDVNLKNPYTIQTMISLERAIGRDFRSRLATSARTAGIFPCSDGFLRCLTGRPVRGRRDGTSAIREGITSIVDRR